MNAIRIRTRIDSITLTAPELGPLIGKQVEIIVLEEEPQISPLLVTRGMFAHGSAVAGDPVADALVELRSERARRLEVTVDEVDPWPSL